MIIWIVEDSKHRFIAAFSTREKADKFFDEYRSAYGVAPFIYMHTVDKSQVLDIRDL